MGVIIISITIVMHVACALKFVIAASKALTMNSLTD
jgi:hypothetical protein